MELEKSYRHSVTLNRQDRLLAGLYGHTAGRILLRLLVSPSFSRLGGYLLDTRLSALAVRPFVCANHIDLTDCQKQSFSSYNDFFTRKLRPEARPVCWEEDAWVSPCDARLSVYPIRSNGHFLIKNTQYTLDGLLKNRQLADRYLGGTLWLYRLCVDDYHRYIYPVDGVKSENIHIPGIFHTVNPVANDYYPIYKENTREYCLIRTKTCGTVLMMEVGAMLVGKIENRHQGRKRVHLGWEKGNFAFGGSTIILLTQAGRAVPERQIAENTTHGVETRVRVGEKVGRLCNC
jgi:phosphatidylserine decarboxylase